MGIQFQWLLILEGILIFFAGWRILRFINHYRQTDKTKDFGDRLAYAVKQEIKNRILSTLIIREIMMYHILFLKDKQTGNENAYSYHKKIGYGGILGAFIFVLALEGTGVSMLLHNWNTPIAIIHLVLSIYMIVYLIADYKAIKKNPVQLDDERIIINFGLRLKANVMLQNIAAIRSGKLHYENDKRRRDILDLTLLGLFDPPDFEIVLEEPVIVTDFLGRETPVTKIYLSIDDSIRFLNEVNSLLEKRTLCS
ncbi:hypothetical protein [Peribacillus sp. SCS-155]|uniref:hypothetical protein n=1 Tax=Peribacillus sedimenti TaxID=3115297 RepID=UPI00390621CD